MHFTLVCVNYLLLANLGTSTRKLNRRLFILSSQRLRRKALRDTTMTLETLNEARALEISETQAKDTESSGNAANASLPTPSRPKKNCFNCGGIWPHDSKTGCPARNRKYNGCHKYVHYAKCCTQKSRETRNSRKGKQSRGRGNPKEKKKPNVNRLKAECEERETLSSSDDEYTFRLEVPASKVSAPFVSLKVLASVLALTLLLKSFRM